jgi:hypothetical protein
VNSYKLSNRDEDRKFLEGDLVKGTAVFLKTEFDQHGINKDDKIVVVLSNGKKYMGKVVSFRFATRGDIVEGQLELNRM